MADLYLLESGSPDGYLLEDGTGVLLLDAITTVSLTDNFDDNSLSASWTSGNFADPSAATTGVTVAETNQRTEVTGPASTAAVRYSGRISAATYDVTDKAIFIKIANVASLQGAEIAYLAFGTDVSNHYAILLSTSGGLHLDLQRWVGGGNTTVGQVFFSGEAWFRLRHLSDGDKVLVDTASSSASDPPIESDWTNRLSETRNSTALVLATASLAFGGGLFGSTATPTVIQFDGFNTATVSANPALTGQSLTGAIGSLLAVTSIALTGQSLSVSQGTVLQGAPLTGQSVTAARGSTTPSTSVALTGQALAAVQGSVAATNAEALSGQSLAGSQGTITPGIAEALTGQAIVAVRGSVTQSSSIALSGQSAAAAPGTLTPTLALGLSGLTLTAVRGTVTVASSPDVTAALTGQSLTGAVGSIVPTASPALSGQALSLFTGSIVPGYSLVLGGQALAGLQGSIVGQIIAPTAPFVPPTITFGFRRKRPANTTWGPGSSGGAAWNEEPDSQSNWTAGGNSSGANWEKS